jgi:hypothetical protein
MSLIGRRPVIQKSGDAASSAAENHAGPGFTKMEKSGPAWFSRGHADIDRNSEAAATIAIAPPIADHTASASASIGRRSSDDAVRSTTAYDARASAM